MQLLSYKYGPGSLSTGETYVFGGARYPFTLLIRLTNSSGKSIELFHINSILNHFNSIFLPEPRKSILSYE